MKIKTTLKFHLPLVRKANIKRKLTNADENTEKKEPLLAASGVVN